MIAGAVGVRGAQDAVEHLLGDSALCAAARAALVDVAREAVRSSASPFLTVLTALPTADHASRLRIRARELKGHLDGI